MNENNATLSTGKNAICAQIKQRRSRSARGKKGIAESGNKRTPPRNAIGPLRQKGDGGEMNVAVQPSIEAEKGILGSILQDANVFDEVHDKSVSSISVCRRTERFMR